MIAPYWKLISIITKKNISVVENGKTVPFNVKAGLNLIMSWRGITCGHAHKELNSSSLQPAAF